MAASAGGIYIGWMQREREEEEEEEEENQAVDLAILLYLLLVLVIASAYAVFVAGYYVWSVMNTEGDDDRPWLK